VCVCVCTVVVQTAPPPHATHLNTQRMGAHLVHPRGIGAARHPRLGVILHRLPVPTALSAIVRHTTDVVWHRIATAQVQRQARPGRAYGVADSCEFHDEIHDEIHDDIHDEIHDEMHDEIRTNPNQLRIW
jgi:hypothetical protein